MKTSVGTFAYAHICFGIAYRFFTFWGLGPRYASPKAYFVNIPGHLFSDDEDAAAGVGGTGRGEGARGGSSEN